MQYTIKAVCWQQKAVVVQYYENAAENTGGVLFLASSGYCDTTTIHNQIGTIPICNIYRILSCSANRNSNSDFFARYSFSS